MSAKASMVSCLSAAYEDFGNSAASGKAVTTIDHTTNDNGFLHCTRGGYANPMLHDTTAVACSNLTSHTLMTEGAGGATLALIVGHGNEGLLITGEGQSASDTNKYISTWNRSSWEPHFKTLRGRQFPALQIVSCHTGAGDAGADLLFWIAQAAQKPVQARTGFTYCSGGKITYEPGSVWQVATPTVRPNPIEAPSAHFDMNLIFTTLDSQGSHLASTIDQVTSLNILTAGRIPVISASGDGAADLLSMIELSNPAKPGGVVGAVITGIIEVDLVIQGQTIRKVFNLYNDRIAELADEPGTYYRVARSLRDALNAQRSRL